jgi:spore maturation protein SpmB
LVAHEELVLDRRGILPVLSSSLVLLRALRERGRLLLLLLLLAAVMERVVDVERHVVVDDGV